MSSQRGRCFLYIVSSTDGLFNPGISLSLSNSLMSVSSSTVLTGNSVQVTLALRDNNNNPYYQASTTVSFSTIGGTSTGTFGTLNNLGNGTYTASFTGTAAGTATTLIATINGQQFSGNLPTVTVTSGAPVATRLVFTGQPSATGTAGSNLATQPVVTAENGSGVTDPTYSTAVTLSAYTDSGCTTSATGTLSGSATTTSGIATFSGVQFTKAITIYLKASSGSLTTACSSAIALSAGSASQLVFTQSPPATATAGVALTTQPQVQIEDANNNFVSSSGVSIALSVYSDSTCTSTPVTTTPNGSSSVLNATVSSNGSGASLFTNFTITDAASLYVKAVAGSLTGCSSVVAVGMTPSTLVFTTPPASTLAATFAFTTQPVVTAEDAYGNISGTFSSSVTLAAYTGSSCTGAATGSLTGTSVTASAGTATFTALNYSKAGPIYFGASGGGLTGCSALVNSGGLPVAAVYPSNGANWNDYIKRTHATSGWTVYNQPDTACAGTENGYYNCIHGGEKRKIVVGGITTCTGLTLSETLGAFNWICDASSGTATYYTRGLQTGMGLKNLVNATSFIVNPVTISLTGNPIVITPSTAWWANTIAALPANTSSSSAPEALTTSGGIYTLSASTTTSGYDLSSAGKISIVTLGSAQLTYSGYSTAWCSGTGTIVGSGGTTTNLCVGSNFNWIEGSFNGSGATDAATIAGGNFVRVHSSQFYNGNTGLDILSTSSSLVENSEAQDNWGFFLGTMNYDTVISNKASNGFFGFVENFGSGSNNVFYNNVIFNIQGTGFQAFGGAFSNNNFILNGVFNSGNGFLGQCGFSQNTVLGMTSLQSAGNGIDISCYESSNSLTNLVVAGAAQTGVNVDNLSSGNVFTDVFAANDGNAVYVGATNPANNNDFYGLLEIGNNLYSSCDIASGSSGSLLDSSCNHGAGLLIAPVTGANSSASYLGPLTTNDTINPTSQTLGTASYSAISDWLDFQSFFRGWGNSGTFLTAYGACWTGTCQILDTRLKAADTLLRNHYGAATNGAACPSSVDASIAANVITDLQSTPHTFLKNAVEVMDPSLNPTGNFDGLCESGEVCIYTPNLGSYQGEGDFTTRTCTFNGGNGVTGVTMYFYPTNGD